MLRPSSRPRIASEPSLSRRLLLRGAGVAMGLPWLESLPVWGSPTAQDTTYPRRFAALFMACGVNPDHWWAKGQGTEMELGKSLEPLRPFQSQLNFFEGLFNQAATGVGIHPGQTGNILSGAALRKGAELGGGVSIDQVLARHWSEETVQPSLVLGCEQPITGYHETNFSMAYSSHISWQNATSPVPMEVYPALAFDSLFENRGSQRDQSILDRVQEHARSLAQTASAADRRKLDEYLTSVREVEQRVSRVRSEQDRAVARSATSGESLRKMDRPQNGLPEDIREHMRLMCDIVALGFQTDKTRVATLLLCRDISGLFYPFLDVRQAHHATSHYDRSDEYERVTRFYCSQLAYLASKLAAMQEGTGTVLDHSCLLFLNNMWSGSKHDSTKVPLVSVGSLGGKLQTGRVLNYRDRGDTQRRLCSLYLAIAQRLGVPLQQFGDADQPLADL